MSSFPLNPEQQEAVNFRDGYAVVASGPGSGKTRTTVERVNAILAEGYPPETILATTFTREAAQEMAKRAKLSDDQKIFRTFHSLCLELIHKEAKHFPFQLLHAPPEPGQQRKLLGTLCRSNKLDFKKLTSYISAMKRKGFTFDQAMEEARGAEGLRLALAYKQYETKCREEGWLDFDSMIIETVNLLKRNEEVRKRWQYKFVIVDEAQDTDDLQWQLVTLLSEEHKNVFAVGDEEQLIYAWRGAEADGLSKFANRFPGCKTIYLFRNYRSTEQIVQFCKHLAPKKSVLIDRMVSEVGTGRDPVVRRFASDADEASKILSMVAEPERSAILTRTNRQLARFENACIDRGIKYNLLGKSGFWTQPEVRYVLAYAQATEFPTDAAVKTIIQSPYRETKYLKKKDLIHALDQKAKLEKDSVGKSTPYISSMTSPEILQQFETHQQDNIRRVAQFVRSMKQQTNTPAHTAIQTILDRADVKVYYETEEEGDGDNDAIENINELYKVAARFGDVRSFLDHARKAIAASRKSKQPRLSLSTVHQAKGKEWDYVFVAGVNHEVLPHKRGEIMEERRIFYVACTRAAKELTVSFFGTPSTFLKGFWTPELQTELDKQPVIGYKGQPTLFDGLL
jgi:DNA helicase II / ATP-dependent DNA helicase PcrA